VLIEPCPHLGRGRPRSAAGVARPADPRITRVRHSRTCSDTSPRMVPGVQPRPAQRQRTRNPRQPGTGNRGTEQAEGHPAHRTPDNPQRLRASVPTRRPGPAQSPRAAPNGRQRTTQRPGGAYTEVPE